MTSANVHIHTPATTKYHTLVATNRRSHSLRETGLYYRAEVDLHASGAVVLAVDIIDV